MRADVFLYDPQCKVLKVGLDIKAFDTTGVVLVRKVAALLGTEWGARLTWPKPTRPNVFHVAVDDLHGAHAPANIGDLNGDAASLRVDAVIYPLPPPVSGSSTGPSTFGGIPSYISGQRWSDHEQTGVRRLVEAYVGLLPLESPDLAEQLERWARRLEGLGIGTELFAAAGRASYA